MAAADAGSLDAPGSTPRGRNELDSQSRLQRSPILMIGRDPTLMSYKAAVLRTASLSVDTAFAPQAQSILEDGADYKVVVLSHTLEPDEALHIHQIVRAGNAGTKLLLMLGPGGTPLNCELFDAALRGLDGPAALIAKVRELLNGEPTPVAPQSCFDSGR